MSEQRFFVYLELEEYLAQWLVNEHGGEVPIEFIRGSAERDILELFLTKRPKGYRPEQVSINMVPIVIPWFKKRDPKYYHYFDSNAKNALKGCIINRFDVQMWQDLHRFGYIGKQQKDIIYAWMSKHGIDDSHWDTIAKRYQRKRNAYLATQRKEMSRLKANIEDKQKENT